MEAVVTICVPLYNVKDCIARCAKSLFEQTYSDVEYIFVDDCSPDDSVSVLSRVMGRYPERKQSIKIIKHNRNRGLSAARNTAIENCTGEFIMHVDSDDFISLDAVEKLVKKQQETDADIVTGQVIQIHKSCLSMMERPHFDDKDDFIEDMIKPTIHHTIWGRLIKKSLYTDYNIQAKEGINIGEDLQIMPQLSYYAKKVESIWDVVYYYDCTNENSYMNQYKGVNLYRLKQDTASMEVVRDFFVGKSDRFQNLAERYLYDYYWTLLEVLGKDVSRAEFHDIKSRLSLLNPLNCKNITKRKIKLAHYYLFLLAKHIAKLNNTGLSVLQKR